jgi:replicative DNA helicase
MISNNLLDSSNPVLVSMEAEQAVLGGIILNPSLMDEVTTKLKAWEFSRIAHQTLYSVLADMHASDKALDLLTITTELQNTHKLDTVGGVGYLTDLAGIVPAISHVSYYIDIVKDKAANRQIAETAQKTSKIALDSELTQEEKLQKVELLVDELRPDSTSKMVSSRESKQELFDWIDQEDKWIKTGLEHYDNWAGGVARGWLYVLAGRTGVGKTAKMLSMLYGIASQGKGSCLVWSQEMARPELYERMVSSLTGIPLTRISKRMLSDQDRKDIADAMDYLGDFDMKISDTPSVSIDEVRAVARHERKKGKIAAIFIDYLGIMDIQQRPGEVWSQSIGHITRKAKNLARELDCVVILLSQLNRQAVDRGKPQASHLRESGNIEQDADLIEILWNDPNEEKVQGGKHAGAQLVQSAIVKGRRVGTNDFRYAFQNWKQHFVSLGENE